MSEVYSDEKNKGVADPRLLPCPFCLRKAYLKKLENYSNMYQIACTASFYAPPPHSVIIYAASEEWAIRVWNTRPPMP